MRRHFWVEIGFGFLCALVGLIGGLISMSFLRAVALILVVGVAIPFGMATYDWLIYKGESRKKCLLWGGMVGVVLFGVGIVSMQIILKGPIFVSPSEADLTYLFDMKPEEKSIKKPLMGYIDFDIHNKSDETYYQIWFKIILDSEFLTSKTVLLDFPTIAQKIKNGEPERSAMLHSICFRGSKGKGDYRKEFYCFLDQLDPQNHFVVRLFSEYEIHHLSEKQIGKVRTEVVKFSDHPARNLVSDPNVTIAAQIEMITPSEFSSDRWIIFCPDIDVPWKNAGIRFLCTYNSPGRIVPKGARIEFKADGPSWLLNEPTILNVTIGNTGTEVAYDLGLAIALTHNIESRSDAVEERVYAHFLKHAHVDHLTELRVNQGELKTIITPKMTKQDISELNDGRMLLFLLGFVTYKDMYGEHRVELCQIAQPPGDKDVWQVCHLHNRTIN